MATNRNIVQQQEVEVILPGELATLPAKSSALAVAGPSLPVVLASMKSIVAELSDIRSRSMALKVTDKPTRDQAEQLNKEWKAKVKEGEEAIKHYKDIVNKFKEQYILVPEREVVNAGEEIKGILGSKMKTFDDSERRAAEAEQERLRKEEQDKLRREAEEKRRIDEAAAKERKEKRVAEICADLKAGKIGKRKAEQLLREAGATEEADKAKAAADQEDANKRAVEQASQVEVKPNISNAGRVTYSARCVDVDGFLSEFVRCSITSINEKEKAVRMRPMIQVSDQALSAEARAKIKTRTDDDNPAHIYTKEQFEQLFPCVKVDESRSF